MTIRLIVFLCLNFAALALGGMYTGKGVVSDWYLQLHKAPWTPPGWLFGFAWTSIMVCFSIYMAMLWPQIANKTPLLLLYAVQLLLNVLWNPFFFKYHALGTGLLIIMALNLLVVYMLWRYWPTLGYKSLLISPYAIWLLIATSLNAYAYLVNRG